MPAIAAFRVKTRYVDAHGADTFRAERNDLQQPARSCGTFDRFRCWRLLSEDRSPDAFGAAVVRLLPAPPTFTTFALALRKLTLLMNKSPLLTDCCPPRARLSPAVVGLLLR